MNDTLRSLRSIDGSMGFRSWSNRRYNHQISRFLAVSPPGSWRELDANGDADADADTDADSDSDVSVFAWWKVKMHRSNYNTWYHRTRMIYAQVHQIRQQQSARTWLDCLGLYTAARRDRESSSSMWKRLIRAARQGKPLKMEAPHLLSTTLFKKYSKEMVINHLWKMLFK